MGCKWRDNGRESGAKCREMYIKCGKIAGKKSRNGNNLAKLNDAKRMVLASISSQSAMDE